MSKPSENYYKVKSTIPSEVKLIAISKTKSNQQILDIYNCGQRAFGESKVQELTAKFEQLPDDIEWHMVGHLQTNKVKFIVPFISMIHSVDSLKLLNTINREAEKVNRTIDCLLQMHIAEEETKYGFDDREIFELLQSQAYREMKNIRIRGLMCMATFTDNRQQLKREFSQLMSYFNQVKEEFFKDDEYFSERSMGMSDDYLIAIEEGSTMVRVGSLIFGNR